MKSSEDTPIFCRDEPCPHTTVPYPRAHHFLEKLSSRDKVLSEAAKYYALYHPDPSWSDLSLALTRAQETEAVERAIEIMTGMYNVRTYQLNVVFLSFDKYSCIYNYTGID